MASTTVHAGRAFSRASTSVSYSVSTVVYAGGVTLITVAIGEALFPALSTASIPNL